MANLNDLPIPNLRDAGLQLILDIRSRRNFVPNKPIYEPKSKSKRQPIPPESVVANMSEQQITELYYKLMAKQQGELL